MEKKDSVQPRLHMRFRVRGNTGGPNLSKWNARRCYQGNDESMLVAQEHEIASHVQSLSSRMLLIQEQKSTLIAGELALPRRRKPALQRSRPSPTRVDDSAAAQRRSACCDGYAFTKFAYETHTKNAFFLNLTKDFKFALLRLFIWEHRRYR